MFVSAAPSITTSHTTVAAQAVSLWVAQHYGLHVQQCYLIRRNLNDNYAVRATDGGRYVARICAIRPRGPFNVDFEVALLTHLHAQGVGVATPVLAADGAASVTLPFPEGQRALVLFRHCEGAVPDTPEELHLTGAALARPPPCGPHAGLPCRPSRAAPSRSGGLPATDRASAKGVGRR